MVFCIPEKGFRRKKRKLFGKGKYFICGGEEKGVKYLEKEKIFLGRRRNTEKVKEGNIWRKKKILFGRRRNTEKEKGENIWRRKKHFWGGKGNKGKYLEEKKIILRRGR